MNEIQQQKKSSPNQLFEDTTRTKRKCNGAKPRDVYICRNRFTVYRTRYPLASVPKWPPSGRHLTEGRTKKCASYRSSSLVVCTSSRTCFLTLFRLRRGRPGPERRSDQALNQNLINSLRYLLPMCRQGRGPTRNTCPRRRRRRRFRRCNQNFITDPADNRKWLADRVKPATHTHRHKHTFVTAWPRQGLRVLTSVSP